MGLQAALQAISDAVAAAVTQAQIVPYPVDFDLGWPTGDQLRALIATKTSTSRISVYPTRMKNVTASGAMRVSSTSTISPTLTATVTGNQIAFAGTPAAGINIHAFVGKLDAFYQTTAFDSLETIAIEVAAAISQLGIPGCYATQETANVIVSGATLLAINVGVSNGGTIITETGRIAADVQVSVWSNDPILRIAIRDAIAASVGSVVSHSLALPDGTLLSILYATDTLNDNAQETYNLYESHIVFSCEFSNTVTSLATAVEGTSITQIIDDETTVSVAY